MANYSKIIQDNTYESYEDYLNSIDYFYDNKTWDNASEIDTKESYEFYLKEYPNGFFIKKANDKLELIKKDNDKWKEASKTNSQESYQKYLDSYQNGTYNTQAKEKIKDFKEWETTKTTDTKSAYEKYLKNHPNGVFKQEANSKLKAIQHNEELLRTEKGNDEKAWATALNTNTQTSYEAYLYTQPKGNYINDARQKIDKILQDEKAWNIAKDKDTKESYQKYLKQFSKGIYHKKASIRFNEILNDEKLKYEEELWEKANIHNDILKHLNKLEEYLENTELGKYTSIAEKRIKKLNKELATTEYLSIFVVFVFVFIIVYFVFFHINDTKFYLDPSNPDRVVINGVTHHISNGEKIELPFKYNTIKVEKKGYKSETIEDIRQGTKRVVIFLKKGYFMNLKIIDSITKKDIVPNIIQINGIDKKIIYEGDAIYELTSNENTILVEKDGYFPKVIVVDQDKEDLTISLQNIYKMAREEYSAKKYKQAFHLFKQISTDERTWFYLGYLYNKLDKDYDKSMDFYEKSCMNGTGAACNNLANQYSIGVAIDNKKAFQYYKKSADLGDDYGACNTALGYYNGDGVDKNIELAKKYLKNATTDIESCNDLKKTISSLKD